VTQLAARILLSALVAALLTISRGDTAHSQSNSVSVYKEICSPTLSACGVASVTPGAAVIYRVSLANLTVGALSVDLQESFPPGFHLSSASCANVPLTQTAVTGLTIFLGAAALPAAATPGSAGPTVECLIVGWFSIVTGAFNNANNQVSVVDHATRLADLGASNNINAAVSVPGLLPTDLSILKTAPTSVDISAGPQSVQYTITISNTGANATDVFLGPFFTLQDRLSIPPTSVPLIATFVGATGCTSLPASGASSGSDCLSLIPSGVQSPLTLSVAGADFVQWKYATGSQGLLKAGGSIVLTYQVTIAPVPGMTCRKQANGDRVVNRAFIALVAAPLVPGGPTTMIGDTDPANNTTAASTSDVQVTTGAPVTNPLCGEAPDEAIQLVKSQTPVNPTAGFPWSTTVTYRLQLTNLSQRTISNIRLHDPATHSLGDLIQERLGTPPFRSTLAGVLCSTSICSNNAWPPGFSQQLSGYNDVKWMFGTTVYATSTTHLHAGETKWFDLKMKFSNPACDSYPAIAPKPIGNTLVATYQDVLQGTSIPTTVTVQSNRVITLMMKPPACNLEILKSVDLPTTKVVFGQPFSYTVKFKNTGLQPQTYGTLRDVMRTTAGYATSLSVDYHYTCGPSPAGSVMGFPGSILTTGTVLVSNTSLPQQGVAIIQNTTPVTFPPGATLTCNVTVKVNRPSPSDPYCAASGKLDNVAFADTSASYNSSIQWPPDTTPGNVASVSLPLPRCFNLVVNKFVVNPPPPPWTTVNGGPITYDITVTNFGPPIAGTLGTLWNGPVLTDAFSSPSPFTTPVFANVKVGSTITPCAWTSIASPCGWLAGGTGPTSPTFPTPFNPSWMAIRNLGTGQTMTTRFTAASPYPPPPAQVCNEAEVSMSGLNPDDWYWKDPNTLQSHVCVPVLTTADLTVRKLIVGSAPGGPPIGNIFTVIVTCTLNGQPYGPNATLTFSSPSPPDQIVHTIPVGSTCLATEQNPPFAPVPWAACTPAAGAAWGQPSYPLGSSVTIQAGTNLLAIENRFDCLPPTPGSLTIIKSIINLAPIAPPPIAFTVNVVCTSSLTGQQMTSVLTFNYPPNPAPQTIASIPAPATCQITEVTPPATVGHAHCGGPVQSLIGWTNPAYPNSIGPDGTPQSVTVQPNQTPTLRVGNTFHCHL
jgi:hypothetical protein